MLKTWFLNNNMTRNKRLFFLYLFFLFFLFFLTGEFLLSRNKNALMTVPAVLSSASFQYEAAVFSRQVFPLKEQRLVNFNWKDAWGFPETYINEKGYRGKDFIVPKPQGVVRIMFYGGSAVFDLAMPEGKDWPHRVEDLLKAKGIKNVEVINAGIPGLASYDSLGRFFAEGHNFEPDYVVLNNAWNDLKRFASDEPLLRDAKPFQEKSNPFLQYQNGIDRFFGTRFLIYNFFRYKFLKVKYKHGPEGAVPVKQTTSQINPQALNQYQLNLELFIDCARNVGAVPLLMKQPRLISADNELSESHRLRHAHKWFPHGFIVKSFVETDRIIAETAKKKGVKVIEADSFLNENVAGRYLFIDHVHLTDAGSQMLAEKVADEMFLIINKEE
jgi:lysophospholipase L1-like esterase